MIAGRQQVTRDWWTTAPDRFELVISDLVRQEAAAGDPETARARLAELTSLALLAPTGDAQELAERLIDAGAIPETALQDAAHIGIAAANGIEYLLTWNFRHIANAVTRPLVESVCRRAGFASPVICTPDELMGETKDER